MPNLPNLPDTCTHCKRTTYKHVPKVAFQIIFGHLLTLSEQFISRTHNDLLTHVNHVLSLSLIPLFRNRAAANERVRFMLGGHGQLLFAFAERGKWEEEESKSNRCDCR